MDAMINMGKIDHFEFTSKYYNLPCRTNSKTPVNDQAKHLPESMSQLANKSQNVWKYYIGGIRSWIQDLLFTVFTKHTKHTLCEIYCPLY